ncbi:hypothetical protein BK011_02335 [Tenericutes bacterium MZ-XQ]|nr:hypothetical protein BK011_02335 [Tenericutes bacterium MZ-XQ]
MKLSEVVKLINDTKLVKDADFNQLGMATSEFTKFGVLSFLSDVKFINSILDNQSISAVITTEDLVERFIQSEIGVIVTENPKASFYALHNHLVEKEFYWEKFDNMIDQSASISPNATLDNNSIQIGKNSKIEDGVIIHGGVIIGDNVTIRSNTVLGSSGFQFLSDNNTVIPVKTGGLLYINDNVEVQHNCCIDRGVLGGKTILKNDVKIDNFVHIAHDCIIGERTFITAGVKFGGRTVVGKDCWLGINATISNGLVIGDNVTVSLGSVVTRNVPDNSTVTGNFAIDHSKFIAFLKTIR